MFGKAKDDNNQVTDQRPQQPPQPQRAAPTKPAEPVLGDQASTICRGMTVVGKIIGEGALNVFGQVEGELRAATVVVNEGARVEGDVVADDLTIGGEVRGTIRASRVKLKGSAVVEGDIFHRSLTIEENARFEGSSKREDNAAETARTPSKRPGIRDELPAKVAFVDAGRKPNGGAPAHDAHPGMGAL
jgi:cytoskeletal protein CcmA (bactofilin family)